MGETRKEKLLRRLQSRLRADGSTKRRFRESVAKIRAELAMSEEISMEVGNAGSTYSR